MADGWSMIERALGLLVTLTGLLTWVGGPIGYFLLRRRRAAEDRKAEAEASNQEAAAHRQVVEMVAMPATYWEKLATSQATWNESLRAYIGRVEQEHEAYRKARIEEISALEIRIAGMEARLELQDDHIAGQDKVILALRNEAAVWKRGVEILIGQLERAGLQPEWRPPTEDK